MASSLLLAFLALSPLTNAHSPSAAPNLNHLPSHNLNLTHRNIDLTHHTINSTQHNLNLTSAQHNINLNHQPLSTRNVAASAGHVAMAIDTTGSMGTYLGPLRTSIRRLLTTRPPSSPALPNLILSPFHDPFMGPVTSTTDAIDFLAALESLSFVGGGDCPEMSLSGALAALERVTTGGTLVVVTDASAKDAEKKEEVIVTALRKSVKVLFFLFDGLCGTGEPAYGEIADATGGQVLTGLGVEDVTKLGVLLEALLKGVRALLRVTPAGEGAVVDVTIGGGVGGRNVEVVEGMMKRGLVRRAFASTTVFSVDASVASLVVVVDGGRAVTVTRPDGTVVGATDSNAITVALSRGVVMVLTAPAPGRWIVSVADCEACSISVSGETSIFFDTFALTIGRDGPPAEIFVAGCRYWAVVGAIGTATGVVVEFRKPNGVFISATPLMAGVDGSMAFYGEVTVPTGPFQVYLNARDESGQFFQRALQGVFLVTSGTCPGVTGPGSSSSASVSPASSSASSAVSASSGVSATVSDVVSSTEVSVVSSLPPPDINGTFSATGSAGATLISGSVSATGSAAGETLPATRIVDSSIRPTSTIVETKFIFAPCRCRGKACADAPCAKTPAPAVETKVVIAPCGKPACAQQHDAVDSVTTV